MIENNQPHSTFDNIKKNKIKYCLLLSLALACILVLILIIATVTTLIIVFTDDKDSSSSELMIDSLKLHAKGNLLHDETSGICISYERNTLFVAQSRNMIVEYDYNFNYLTEHILDEQEDTEGIACMPNNTFAVTDEKVGIIRIFALNNDQIHELHKIDTDISISDSSGLEGITYDINRNVLYTIREKDKGSVYEISFANYTNYSNAIIKKLFDVPKLYAKDLSGIYYDHKTDTIFICSDQSELILHLDLEGNLLGRFSIKQAKMDKVEGITIDSTGKFIILVGEDAEYSIFEI